MRKFVEIPLTPATKIVVGVDARPDDTPARLLARAAVAHAKSGGSLRDRDLTGADFTEEDLDGLNFAGSVIANANFAGMAIRGCSFDECEMSEADFSGASLRNVSMIKASGNDVMLDDVDCKNCMFEKWDLHHPSLHGANFAFSNLVGVKFNGPVSDRGLYFKSCNIQDIVFRDAKLNKMHVDYDLKYSNSVDFSRYIEFYDSVLNNGVFNNMNFTDSSFIKVSFRDFEFVNCEFKRTQFDEFSSKDCKFNDCKFRATSWENSKIVGGSVRDTDMSDMNVASLEFSDGVGISNVNFDRLNYTAPKFVKSSITGGSFKDIDVGELVFEDCVVTETVEFGKGNIGRLACDEAKFLASTADVVIVDNDLASTRPGP